MDTADLENLENKESSKFEEHDTDNHEEAKQAASTSYVSDKTENFEGKGAGGDTGPNLDTQTQETLRTAEQLSLKLNKVNTTDREQLNAAAQQIIEDLNSKRRQDNQLLADFRKSLETEVNRICNAVEQEMLRMYTKKSDQIQVRIQELYACLDRICKIETELQEFKQALQILYQDMNSTH